MLNDLKVGDKVAVNHSPASWTIRYEVETVTKVSPRKITTDKREYNASNGHEWGAKNNRGPRLTNLSIADVEEHEENVRLKEKRQTLASTLQRVEWLALSIEIQEKILDILRETNLKAFNNEANHSLEYRKFAPSEEPYGFVLSELETLNNISPEVITEQQKEYRYSLVLVREDVSRWASNKGFPTCDTYEKYLRDFAPLYKKYKIVSGT